MKRICVNCGSNRGFRSVYLKAAEELGAELAHSGLELVYGGAGVGLMGEVANAAIRAGGTVIGIIPESFARKASHQGLTELRIVSSMHERKQMMSDLSDAFIALPGGFGTLEEVMELLTWAQLGLNKKPCGLINVAGYFDPFLTFLDHIVAEGFMKQAHRDMLLVSDEPRALLERFKSYVHPNVEKWISEPDRT